MQQTVAGHDADAFIARETRLMRAAYVPEIALHLAREPYGIFQAAEEAGFERPFWSFAWPGGQALARYLLDQPETVAGRSVLDIGAGSGLTSIAAAMAGARHVVANDCDPTACEAVRHNAVANGVHCQTIAGDMLGGDIEADLVLIGEVFYEPEMAMRVTAFLERARRRGIDLLFADRTSIRRPPIAMQLIAEVVAPLTPSLEMGETERARVWRLAHEPRRGGGRRR